MLSPTKTLIQLLADTDALFIPVRKPMSKGARNVHSRRRTFPNTGVLSMPETADPAEQKKRLRQLIRMEAEGVLQRLQPSGRGMKTTGLRLADAGEWQTRELCNLPGLEGTVASIQRLHRLRSSPDAMECYGQLWIPETLLADVEWGDNDNRNMFVVVENMMLPALVRGWVDSNATTHGHVWYSLTDEGTKLATSKRKWKFPKGLPAWEQDAVERYFARLKESQNLFASQRIGDTRDIGPLPLPASMPESGRRSVRTETGAKSRRSKVG